MDAYEMKQRTKAFALRVLKVVDALPNTVKGRAVAGQIVRSGTSVGANYRAACRGRSKAEFAAKMGTVLEEADETAYWLELIGDDGMLPADHLKPLLDEAKEIVAIATASCKTARKN